MITRILQHELKRSLRDGRTNILFIGVVMLSITSIILSFRDYQLIHEQYLENVHQVRVNWESQAEKDPHDAAHDGTYVIKPIYPLVIFDKGIQAYTGQVVHLGAHKRNQSTINESKDRSGMFRFGELTPNFVLVYIFPLLLIFLGYNVFTEEKERQTIRLLLVQGATFRQLSLGKWLALFVQMFLLFLSFMIVALISFSFLEKEVQVHWSEWAGLALTYLLYFTSFTSLIVLVSGKAKHSGSSLTILLSIWIVVTLIVPKVSTNLSGTLYPFPTLQTFKDNIIEDQTNGLNGHNFWNEAAQDFQKEVLEAYGVSSIEELPIEYSGLLLAEGEKYESEVYTKHFDLLQDQYKKQQLVYRICGVFSPMLPTRFVSMALTRTDYGFLWHFEDEAERYRVTFNTALNMNIAEKAKGIDHYKAEASLWSSIPKFQYQWQAVKELFLNHLAEYLISIGWAVFSFLLMLFVNRTIKFV
ncbi:MAG: DUF3526 domain-containing protein [Chitinophagales bacterium]|nr:DUF3526 domain-containing protein [Chitinophagales bacterium]